MTLSAIDRSAYVDTSAFVKWFADEQGSTEFKAEIETWPLVAASSLLEIEAIRVGARTGATASEAVADRLRRVVLLGIDDEIVRSASRVPPPLLRSLDAIHLATALRVKENVGAFFTYDHDLADAAREHGFDVRSPGAESARTHG